MLPVVLERSGLILAEFFAALASLLLQEEVHKIHYLLVQLGGVVL